MHIVTDRKIQNKSAERRREKPLSEMSAEALFAACKPDHRAYHGPVAIRRDWSWRPATAVR